MCKWSILNKGFKIDSVDHLSWQLHDCNGFNVIKYSRQRWSLRSEMLCLTKSTHVTQGDILIWNNPDTSGVAAVASSSWNQLYAPFRFQFLVAASISKFKFCITVFLEKKKKSPVDRWKSETCPGVTWAPDWTKTFYSWEKKGQLLQSHFFNVVRHLESTTRSCQWTQLLRVKSPQLPVDAIYWSRSNSVSHSRTKICKNETQATKKTPECSLTKCKGYVI